MNQLAAKEPCEATQIIGSRERGPLLTVSKLPTRMVSYAKIALTVLHGPDVGRFFEVAGRTVRIGTAADNDLALTDTTVSRYHCEVHPGVTAIDVVDCASTNGTFSGPVLIRRAT